MSQQKRLKKRFKREHRQNKGVSTAAKNQSHAAKVREARRKMGGWDTTDESMLLFAASIMGR